MQPEKDFPQHAADNLLARDAHPFPTLNLTVAIHPEDTYGIAEVDAHGEDGNLLDTVGFDLVRGYTPDEITTAIRTALEQVDHPSTVGADDANSIDIKLPAWAVNNLAIDYLNEVARLDSTNQEVA